MQVRNFFGTGGFGSGNSDADRSVEKSWNRWKIRNGFGASYHLAGHNGDNFIFGNKAVLNSDVETANTFANNLQGKVYYDL